MKRKENRFKVKRLYVLGAGASYSASTAVAASPDRQTPLDKDFCNRIADLCPVKPAWVEGSKEYILKEWRDHIPFKSFGLEQAIIRQIGHLEFIDAIHPRRRGTSISDFEYLNHLSHLICYALRRGREARNGPYTKFVRKVFPKGTKFDSVCDRVITFNYDELLDKTLFENFDIREIYFDRIEESKNTKTRRIEKNNHPLLIKLHGSVNWRCTKDEFANIVASVASKDTEYEIDSIWYSSIGTPSPEDGSSPLIMPPLPIKPITSVRLFRFLWTKAYEYLHEADEIVICGYSLPDADRLAQSMFANFTNKTVKQITIVDPNPGILRKWRDLLRRKSINSRARWMYYEDFGEYVNGLGV